MCNISEKLVEIQNHGIGGDSHFIKQLNFWMHEILTVPIFDEFFVNNQGSQIVKIGEAFSYQLENTKGSY